jgi:hypothetical protein
MKLKTIHRLLIINWLNEAAKNKSLSEINKILKLMDKIDFSAEERTSLNLKIEEGQIKWDSKNDTEQEVELNKEQEQIITDVIQAKDEKKEFSLDGIKHVMEIAEQVDYKFE